VRQGVRCHVPSVRAPHTDAGVAMVTVTSPSAAASRSAFPPPAAPLTIALTPQKPNVSPPHRQGASTLDLYTPALRARIAHSAHQDFRVTHRDRLPFRRGRCAKDAPQTTDRGKSRRPPAFRRIDPFSYMFEACKFIEERTRIPLFKTKTLVHKLTIKKVKIIYLKLGNKEIIGFSMDFIKSVAIFI
jgi:hypothetical protein